MKRIMSLLLVLIMCFGQVTFAQESVFTDMETDHWAYAAVKSMSDRGVIKGYDDGSFKPDAPITRAEFATVMVLALDLQANFNAKSSFIDMDDDHWVVPYVDASKEYLTGYNTSLGTKFKPNENAVREDMAVAIVKARGLDVSTSNEAYLTEYIDGNDIGVNLRPYVGTAVKHEIMVGTTSNGTKAFSPKDVLTRAEACVLLLNIVETDEEKIVLNDSQIKLYTEKTDKGLKLKWTVSNDVGLQGFKVVASKSDKNPIYPENGYVKYLSDKGQREILLSGSLDNHNGDTNKITSGESYYFSITGLYEKENIASNAIYTEYPARSCDTTEIHLEGNMKDGHAVLEWYSDQCDDITGYKIVASKSDESPIYPENGYYTYLAGNHHSRKEIPLGSYYNNGDFSKFEAGETYYFSITALVGDKKLASNTVALKYDVIKDPVVELKGQLVNNSIVLEWSDENDSNISGFKVVASKSDGRPIYPEDGYYKYIAKGHDQRVVINVNDYYNNGDIKYFQAEETYHFSITALVGDKKIASNTVELSFDKEEDPVIKLTGIEKGNAIVLEWSDDNDSKITGYKVVASKSDGSPIYPEDGYFRYIEKGHDQRVVIDINDYYNNGDFNKFEAGKTYNFSITALVGDRKIASNTVILAFDEIAKIVPQVTLEGHVEDHKVILEWVSFNDHDVEGYKIVASKEDGTPIYPENGYYKYIRNGSEERLVIEAGSHYNNGDFDYFQKGEKYYFSITSVYSGGKEASNVISLRFND